MGGAGQYALRLSNALRAAGVDSTVLVPAAPILDGALQLIRVDGGILRFAARVQRSLVRRISASGYHSLHAFESYDSPRRIQPTDIVHLHGMTGWIGVRGLRRLIPAGAKVFQTTHGPWDISGGCVILAGSECQNFQTSCGGCPALSAPWKALARFELKTKTRFAEELGIQPIANGEWMAARIRSSAVFAGIKHVPIVPPIVDNAYFQPEIPYLREKWNIPPANWVISIGARSISDSFKGIPDFLAQLATRPHLANRVTVLVFGEGVIPRSVGLDVRCLGNVTSPAELAAIYYTSDIFVSPSKMESFGMTLAEAQAAGTPVVGFDVGGIRSATWPCHHSHLLPLGDWDGLLNVTYNSLREAPVGHTNSAMRKWASSSFGAAQVARKQISCYLV